MRLHKKWLDEVCERDDKLNATDGLLLANLLALEHIENRNEERHTDIKLMASALENLTAAVATLTTSVDNAVKVLATPHPTDAQVQSAADAVNAQSARLDVADGVTPPTPLPPAPA
jgi:hypothetical protein